MSTPTVLLSPSLECMDAITALPKDDLAECQQMIDFAQKFIQDKLNRNQGKIPVKRPGRVKYNYDDALLVVSAVVSKVFNTSLEELRARSRETRYTDARQCFWYVTRQIYGTSIPLKALAKYLHRLDHTTVISGLKRAADLIDIDQDFRTSVQAVYSQSLTQLKDKNLL